MHNQMGDTYELIKGTGIYVPTLDTLLKGAAGGAISTTAQTLAQSSGIQEAAKTAAGNTLGNKIMDFMINNKKLLIGVGVASTLAVGYFVFFRKK